VTGDPSLVLQLTQVITTSNLDRNLIHSIFTHRDSGHVLLTDGNVYAWGKNTTYLLGSSDTNELIIVSGYGSSLPVFSSVIAEPTDWTPPT